jgi:hypothetical protein
MVSVDMLRDIAARFRTRSARYNREAHEAKGSSDKAYYSGMAMAFQLCALEVSYEIATLIKNQGGGD